MIPEWLFGPTDDLRPLPSPDPDVVNSVDRFGGMHTSLNGGRTVDILGYKTRYKFSLRYLEPDEYFRLEALYTGSVPGPHRLIDPLRRNLLSRAAGFAQPYGVSGAGLWPGGNSTLTYVQDLTSPVPWCHRVTEWGGFVSDPLETAYVAFDRNEGFPVVQGEPFTMSVYVKPTAAMSFYWEVTSKDGVALTGATQEATAGEWSRLTATFAPPTGFFQGFPVLRYASGGSLTDSVRLLCPQAEIAETASQASYGGGASVVVIDELSTTSPRYPLQSVELTLLEV